MDFGLTEARALVADPLWPRIRDFLWDFAPFIEPSRLPVPVGDNGRVRRWALELCGVEPVFHPFPADDGSRLLLLDAKVYRSVARWIEGVARADAWRRVISGAERASLRTVYPDVYPDVLRYDVYFRRWRDRLTPETNGFSVLAGILRDLPPALLARQRLRFEPSLEDSFSPAEGWSAADLELPHFILKLKFPEAYALCCS